MALCGNGLALYFYNSYKKELTDFVSVSSFFLNTFDKTCNENLHGFWLLAKHNGLVSNGFIVK